MILRGKSYPGQQAIDGGHKASYCMSYESRCHVPGTEPCVIQSADNVGTRNDRMRVSDASTRLRPD